MRDPYSQCPLQEVPPFTIVAMDHPEPADCRTQTQSHLPCIPRGLFIFHALCLLQQPCQCSSQVVMLLLQSLQPHRLLCTEEGRLRFLRQRQIVSSMSVPGGLHFATRGQAFQSVLADRFQHHQARLISLLLDLLQEALVDE